MEDQDELYINKMNNLFDVIKTALLIAVMFVLFSTEVALGGSVCLLIVASFVVYLSRIYMNYRYELNLICILMLLLMLLNYTAYVESKNSFLMPVALGASILMMAIAIVSAALAKRPLYSKKDRRTLTTQKSNVAYRVKWIIDDGMLELTLVLIVMTFILFSILGGGGSYQRIPFKLSAVIMFWFIFLLMLHFIRTRKIPDHYFYCAVKPREGFNSVLIKKWIFFITVFIAIAGTAMETVRGLWGVWLVTLVLIIATILFCWRIWKYIALNWDVDTTKLNAETLPLIIKDPVYFVKKVGFIVLILMIYAFGAIYLWYLFWK
jgi:hypothetical protein